MLPDSAHMFPAGVHVPLDAVEKQLEAAIETGRVECELDQPRQRLVRLVLVVEPAEASARTAD